MHPITRVVFVLTFAFAEVKVRLPRGYHIEIGIPLAQKIKAKEDAIVLDQTARIYRGTSAQISNYPFFASLVIHFENNSMNSFCGSALVSVSRLVTAAHCWGDGQSQVYMFTVVLGSQYVNHGGLRINTTEVFQHPDWDNVSMRNDIAVVSLPNKINFTNTIFPIALPEGDELKLTFEGYTATVIGIGLTGSEQEPDFDDMSMNEAHPQILSEDKCRAAFGDDTDDMLCTGSEKVGERRVCPGDSGSPLITYHGQRKILVGIVSFGVSEQCGVDYPAVQTRVSRYMDFIKQHTSDLPVFNFTHIQQPQNRLEIIRISMAK